MKHFNIQRPAKSADESSKKNLANRFGENCCAYCGAIIPQAKKTCLICGAKKNVYNAVAPVGATAAEEWAVNVKSQGDIRLFKRKTSLFWFCAIFLLLVGALGVSAYEYFTYQALVFKYTAGNAAVYTTADNSLKINIKGDSSPTVITTSYSGVKKTPTVNASYDKRFISYFNNTTYSSVHKEKGELYLLDLVSIDDEAAPNTGVFIDSQVVQSVFLPRADKLYYLKENGELYLCDYSSIKNPLYVRASVTSSVIDTDVKGIAQTDGTHVLYYKGGNANILSWEKNNSSESGIAIDLYVADTSPEIVLPELVAQSIYRVEDYTRDFESIIYTRRTRPEPLVMYDVFLYSDKTPEPRQLARDARYIVDASALKGTIIALAPAEETLTFKDIIDDDMLEPDQLITEPTPEDFGYDPNTDYSYVDTHFLDEIFDKYEEAYDAYRQKLLRDAMRKDMRTRIRGLFEDSYLSFALYYTNGDNTLLISENIYNSSRDISSLAWGNAEKGIASFVAGDREVLQKIPMSSLSEEEIKAFSSPYFDIMGYLEKNTADSLWYWKNGSPNLLVFESADNTLGNIFVTPNGNELYFTNTPMGAYSGTLYFATIKDSAVSSIIHVDEDVTKYLYRSDVTGELFYQKFTKGNNTRRDIASVIKGSVKIIASQVDPYGIKTIKDGILSYYKIPEGQTERDFYVYGMQERFISRGVEYAWVESSALLYYAKRESAKYDSLYLYDAGEVLSVDKNIVSVVFIS